MSLNFFPYYVGFNKERNILEEENKGIYKSQGKLLSLQQDFVFVLLRNSRDYDSSVVADRGEDPRIGGTPLAAVDAFFVLLEAFQQTVFKGLLRSMMMELVVFVRRCFFSRLFKLMRWSF